MEGDAAGGANRGTRGNRRRTESVRSVAPENEGATDGETTETDRYYLELGARTDVAEDETVVEGDDIGAVFADALRWYARRVAPSEDPATVVEVLLDGTEFAVTDRAPDR